MNVPEGEAYPTLRALQLERDPPTNEREQGYERVKRQTGYSLAYGFVPPHAPRTRPNPNYGELYSWGRTPQKEETK